MKEATEGFLGLDVGTSAVKALLINRVGDVVATASATLTLQTPHAGWTEQHPERWWEATISCIREILLQRPDARIVSIGISGQMHSSVFLDAGGDVVRPALLWSDGRTTAECAEITSRAGGEEKLREWVSNPALEGFTLPKVLWLRNQEPQSFARVAKILLAKDFIRYRLTGVISTEPSDASGTLMFNPSTLRWSQDLLGAVDIPLQLLPDVHGSSDVHGGVSTSAARATGLSEGTPVVGGGADNACGAAGVGVIWSGEAVASWGTSGTVLAPTSLPTVDPQMRVHTFCHVVPNTWYVMGVVLSAGGAYAWYRDSFVSDTGKGIDATLNSEAASIAPGADGVTFLPYLQGERTPHRNANARAALLGLNLTHTRAHITRAILEGVCFALRDSLSILNELGMSPNALLLTGGGARVPFLRQLQADVFGLPVSTVNREEGPAFGAALLAAVGVNAFSDLSQATRATLIRAAGEMPNVDAMRAYERAYRRFQLGYSAALPKV